MVRSFFVRCWVEIVVDRLLGHLYDFRSVLIWSLSSAVSVVAINALLADNSTSRVWLVL